MESALFDSQRYTDILQQINLFLIICWSLPFTCRMYAKIVSYHTWCLATVEVIIIMERTQVHAAYMFQDVQCTCQYYVANTFKGFWRIYTTSDGITEVSTFVYSKMFWPGIKTSYIRLRQHEYSHNELKSHSRATLYTLYTASLIIWHTTEWKLYKRSF